MFQTFCMFSVCIIFQNCIAAIVLYTGWGANSSRKHGMILISFVMGNYPALPLLLYFQKSRYSYFLVVIIISILPMPSIFFTTFQVTSTNTLDETNMILERDFRRLLHCSSLRTSKNSMFPGADSQKPKYRSQDLIRKYDPKLTKNHWIHFNANIDKRKIA